MEWYCSIANSIVAMCVMIKSLNLCKRQSTLTEEIHTKVGGCVKCKDECTMRVELLSSHVFNLS